MIIDKMLEFADASTAYTNVGTLTIGDVVDLGASPTLKDIGNGEPLYLVIKVDTAIEGASSTSTFKLVSDSTSNLTTSPTTHWASGALAPATLIAGYTVACIALPISMTYERYLGITVTVATANTTAGKVNAFMTTTPPAWAAYSDFS